MVTADAFGDFKFDRLNPTGEAYQLAVELEKYQAVTTTVDVTDTVSLPDIVLSLACNV